MINPESQNVYKVAVGGFEELLRILADETEKHHDKRDLL